MLVTHFRTLWGNTEPLASYLPDLQRRGYAGIETSLVFHSESELDQIARLLPTLGMRLILLILTGGDNVESHISSLATQLRASAAFAVKPDKINVHGGCDWWDWDQTHRYFTAVTGLQREYPDIPLLHETHRSRILFNPWISRKVLTAFPGLRLTADLSHWVLVAERHLTGLEFAATMDLVFERTRHIHARPASPQCIQISHLSDPYWKEDVDAFAGYWARILRKQKELGQTEVSVDPEFGPAPYSMVLPKSGAQIVRSLDECADEVMALVNTIRV
ncbi:hypothetical protein BC830DRAFT_1173938 [Chytriomyces sp. MP71]|nr:hypothetical protein BC830DRAFT_1173938 [Chytriomyces sp. MP71]